MILINCKKMLKKIVSKYKDNAVFHHVFTEYVIVLVLNFNYNSKFIY